MNSAPRGTETAKEKTCCVAGHRNIPADQTEYVKAELRKKVEQAIIDGYDCFLTDLMEGTDQLFAEIVSEICQNNETIRMEAIVPYQNRLEKLFAGETSSPLLMACTETTVTSEKYSPNSYQANRREQLRRSSRMIVVFDGRDKGGTIRAIRMAHAQQVPIQEIPLKY